MLCGSRFSRLAILLPRTASSTRGFKGVVNEVGIAHLEEKLRRQVFGERSGNSERLLDLSLCHLERAGLLGKKTTDPKPVGNIKLPKLLGRDLDEHFQKIGREMSEPYLSWCKDFVHEGNDPDVSTLPQLAQTLFPGGVKLQSGWTRYDKASGKSCMVPYPGDNVIVLDVEVLYKIHDFAVLATAMSKDAWYVWISPWLLGETENPRQLVPIGDHAQVIIGHNVGYDRKRLKEEYGLHSTSKFFIDTMSLHIATGGMCSQQRPHWQKHQKALLLTKDPENVERQVPLDGLGTSLDEEFAGDPWINAASLNSLAQVFAYNYGGKIDKSQRDYFSELDRAGTVKMLPELVEYCAKDVVYTKMIFNRLLPSFLELCPHPVSFGALGPISSLFLPIDSKWQSFIDQAEKTYEAALSETLEKLHAMAEHYAAFVDNPEELQKALQDPWLSQLNWTVKPTRMKKGKKGEPDVPAKNQKLPGKPEWYRTLFPAANKPMNLTVRTRITPLLLRLQWDGYPLVWIDEYGWCFTVPSELRDKYQSANYALVDVQGRSSCTFKILHKEGQSARCTNPLAKSYISHFENGLLSSDNEMALEAIRANAKCSYWLATRERIFKQMPVYQRDVNMGFQDPDSGIILPKMVPMGTITRRAVEDTWLTASNAKGNRIGSELKAMVRAPKGYSFVGADVDSEELWIASLMGDSLFGIHGGTALGWMTLEGSKSEGTDLHSRTAAIMGISRNEAKIFNYGRIYGAGLKFATQLLKQFNPHLPDSEAKETATKLYNATKGTYASSKALNKKQFWRGGSESVVFNQLELMANQEHQKSPVLGAGITTALKQGNLKRNNFLTSRVNWSIQSSGVDYLHLLIASMYYLTRVYDIKARLFLTVHDEIRYMVKDEDVMRAALALQISNLWTRAMFCQQMGFEDLPQSVAFFSLIDIDHVLRKEVDLDCVTPSNPTAIRPGEAIDIHSLLARCESLGRASQKVRGQFLKQESSPRVPVMREIGRDKTFLDYLQSQIALDLKDLRVLEKKLRDRRFGSASGVYRSAGNTVVGVDYHGPVKSKSRKPRQRVKKGKAESHDTVYSPDSYTFDPIEDAKQEDVHKGRGHMQSHFH